jgi:Uma2 family endonuclease
MAFTQDPDTQNSDTQNIDNLYGVVFPPGDFLSDEPPLESELHLRQIMLLIQCLERWWHDRQDFYACGNMTIYYSPRQRKSEQFRGPDFFVVKGTERKPRKSWAVWEEGGKYPNVIIEILSPATANIDRGLKKQIYQDIFRTPEYFWFDPESLEFQGFQLIAGEYQAIQPSENNWLWSQQLGLFLGIDHSKLRFFTPEGPRVLSPEEAAVWEEEQAEQERQRAQQEHQRAERERQRADRLAERLRQLGISPEELE